MRDLAMGKTRFGDFSQSPERIPTNVLTDRLLRLEEFGLIKKRAYQQHPIRYDYALTRKGAELLPVMQAVCKWANKHLPGTWKAPDAFLSLKPSDLTAKKAKADK